jgi:hypothetical protein
VILLQLSFLKGYSIDEFTYSHGAWLVSKGAVPFRDFFETRFPLHYLILAVPFLFSGDNPESIALLRIAILPFVATILYAIYLLAARPQRSAGPIALLVVLGNVTFAISATEIRPDPIALNFFLLAILVLVFGSWAPNTRALASGSLLALSFLASMKAVIYGLAFVPVWLLDVVWNSKRRAPCVLGNPWLFLLGGVSIVFAAITFLVMTGGWSEFYKLAIVRSFDFVGGDSQRSQRHNDLFKLFSALYWLVPLAAWGVIRTIQKLWHDERFSCHPDLILLLALPSALLSYTIQNNAFRYSLIPFIVFFGIFAGRGAAALLEYAVGESRRPLAVTAFVSIATLPLLATLLEARAPFASVLEKRNTDQHRFLRDVGRLTAPDDAIYDNSGSYVTRPHAHSPHHTDHRMRSSMRKELARAVPRSIVRNEAVAVVRDARFSELAGSLKGYLRSHFQPYSQDLWLWGQQYRIKGGTLSDEFRAIKDARYFVWPTSVIEAGSLEIGGRRVAEPIFHLDKGVHALRYHGPNPTLRLLWLPRTGVPYEPGVNRGSRSSQILVDP